MIIHSSYVNDLLIVATEKGVAELSLFPEDIEGIEGEVFYFHRIKVRPEFKGSGGGKELMIEVCKHADELNVTIYNGLNPYGKRNMESLKKFFEASGFEVFGEPDIMIRKPKGIT